jgi:hypothetical protein
MGNTMIFSLKNLMGDVVQTNCLQTLQDRVQIETHFAFGEAKNVLLETLMRQGATKYVFATICTKLLA